MNTSEKANNDNPVEVIQAPEQIFLAQFSDEKIDVTLSDGSHEILSVIGEILVGGFLDPEQTLIVQQIRRVALTSQPLDAAGGSISLAGPANIFEIENGVQGEVPFEARSYYPLITQKLEPACQDSDAVYPQLQTLVGTLTWETVENSGANMRFTLNIKQSGPEFEFGLQEMAFESSILPFRQLESPISIEQQDTDPNQPQLLMGAGLGAAGACNAAPAFPAGDFVHGTLNIRFVSISDPSNPQFISPNSLRPFVEEWVNCACQVWWLKGGIKIVPKMDSSMPPQIDIPQDSFNQGKIQNNTQETSIDSSVGQDSCCIDIYLVDVLYLSGGGVSHNCGTNSAYIILEINKARNNNFLLSHELGHVMGIRHPGPPAAGQCNSFPEGSYCSVMVPDDPNSSRNTEHNFDVLAINSQPMIPIGPPIFQAEPTKSGLFADVAAPSAATTLDFYHMVRDFPYDDGAQPSVPTPPVYDWWTYSDVWNSDRRPYEFAPDRLYDPGNPVNDKMFHDDHSPKHTRPRHITGTADSSQPQNFLCVRLHTCQPLVNAAGPVPVSVDLYLGLPGLSPDVIPLVGTHHNLNTGTTQANTSQLSFDPLPEPGTPKVQYLQWQVKSSYPSHCCVFAVARSSLEPSPVGPSPVSLSTLKSLRAADGDVAQRNLDIQYVSMIRGASLMSTVPWTQVSNFLPEAAEVSIEIDSTLSPTLESLVLEAGDQQIPDIKPGLVQHIKLHDALPPGEVQILRIQTVLPPDQPIGATFPVDLRFFVNGELITGYRYVLRLMPLRDTLLQVLDQLFGMLEAVAVGFNTEIASKLKERVRTIYLREQTLNQPAGCWGMIQKIFLPQTKHWQFELRRLAGTFANLAQSLKTPPDSEPERRVVQYLQALADLLLQKEDAAPPNVLLEQIRELADRIQEPASRLARKKIVS